MRRWGVAPASGATVTIYNPDLDPGARSAPGIAGFVLEIVDLLRS
jgi:hypothetical protein